MWMLLDIAEARGPGANESRSWVTCRPRGHSAFSSEQELRRQSDNCCPEPQLVLAPCSALYLPEVLQLINLQGGQ